MSRATIVVLALIAAFAGGTASAAYVVSNWLQIYGQQSGPWKRLSTIGQPNADPYTRAYNHISNLMPVGGAEGQIYLAEKDSANQVLDAACTYLVAGDTPAARLFTLRMEGPDGNTIATPAPFQSALHSDGLVFAGTTFSIGVSTSAQPGNWLYLPTDGTFRLILTYYDVAVINDDTGNSTRLPAITKVGCDNA